MIGFIAQVTTSSIKIITLHSVQIGNLIGGGYRVGQKAEAD
jgi:hypothetical protein